MRCQDGLRRLRADYIDPYQAHPGLDPGFLRAVVLLGP
jgi:hypothetical protein